MARTRQLRHQAPGDGSADQFLAQFGRLNISYLHTLDKALTIPNPYIAHVHRSHSLPLSHTRWQRESIDNFRPGTTGAGWWWTPRPRFRNPPKLWMKSLALPRALRNVVRAFLVGVCLRPKHTGVCVCVAIDVRGITESSSFGQLVLHRPFVLFEIQNRKNNNAPNSPPFAVPFASTHSTTLCNHFRVAGSVVGWLNLMCFCLSCLLNSRNISAYEFQTERAPLLVLAPRLP